jgi:vancomycin resistance protein YoaR
MRKSYWATLMTTALIGVSSAQAAPQVADSAGIAQVEVRGKTEYKLAPHEFEAYVGSYKFDSGEVMKVWQRGTRYYSQLKNQPEQELLATSAGNFTTASGARLAFSEDGNWVTVDQSDKKMVAAR